MHDTDSEALLQSTTLGRPTDADSQLKAEVVIQSARDQRVLNWLVSQVGAEAVAAACHQLRGQRRPYVSNLARVLRLSPPDELVLTPLNEAKIRLAQCKSILNGCK